MKKAISILLTFLILFANSGWALAFHYCKEELVAISLNYPSDFQEVGECQKEKSCCEETDDHQECCDNQQVEVKSSDNKLVTKVFELNLSAFTLVQEAVFSFEEINSEKSKRNTPAFYADVNAPPLYKLYCQWVFYA